MSPKEPEIRPLAVIPVYNHASTLRQVAEQTLSQLADVLVVDDGSTDNGLDVLRGLDVHTLRHPTNQGKGAAILTSAKYAAEHGFTHILTLDADGQHDPADLLLFLPLLAENPDAVIVGCRDFSCPNVPGASKFGRSFSNFWLRVQTGVRLTDVQSGFRAYPVAVLRALHLRERRYSFEVEVLVKAAWAGFQLREVGISVHYPEKSKRISHFRALHDNLLITLLNTRLTARAFLPLPHRQLGRDETGAISALHPIRSLRLLLAAQNTPRTLALASGLGVFVGAFPILGFHCLTLVLLTGLLGLSKIAALAANQLCIPPFMPAICIEVGYFLRHGRWLTEISFQTLGYEAHIRLLEWLLGAFVVGPTAGLVMALVVYALARPLQTALARKERT
ncbi:DUF2062 domain-containing protein [Paucidesulfovibrio longus]|uniref:DUF2062 domain-containing protein n=1 Tax=Paucidesulfovibrio longus TaxID=889 RepID=UPI0003B69D44|nr:DUF2062 domain-containing protein [Paucidesulfovibrio longus]